MNASPSARPSFIMCCDAFTPPCNKITPGPRPKLRKPILVLSAETTDPVVTPSVPCPIIVSLGRDPIHLTKQWPIWTPSASALSVGWSFNPSLPEIAFANELRGGSGTSIPRFQSAPLTRWTRGV